MFSGRVVNDNDTSMLNIWDAELLGKTLSKGNFNLKINENYEEEKIDEKEEGKDLLRSSNSINIVGKEIVSFRPIFFAFLYPSFFPLFLTIFFLYYL